MHNLFYRNFAGHFRPRRYVAAVIAILVLLTLVAVIGRIPPRQEEGQTGQQIISNAVEKPAAAAAVRAPAAAPTPLPAGCPEEPDEWAFQPVFPDDHYRRIEPVCVVDGLARTAAWMLLIRMGYAKPRAAEMLGFDGSPWAPELSFTGYTNRQGPLEIALQPGWPPHPEFEFWHVDREGRPGVTLSLRGCYAAGGDVYCILALDKAPGSAVSVLGEHHFASHAAQAPILRTFSVLRYAGGGTWDLVGQMEGVSVELENLEETAGERLNITMRLESEPWDAGWLADQFDLRMNPLPRDWRLYGLDESAIQAIGEELNAYIPESFGGDDG